MGMKRLQNNPIIPKSVNYTITFYQKDDIKISKLMLFDVIFLSPNSSPPFFKTVMMTSQNEAKTAHESLGCKITAVHKNY